MQDRLAEDFRVFLFLVWQHLRLPEPTQIQYDIASYLQSYQRTPKSANRRRIVEAFRGVGKSWITVSYVLWRLYRNPQLKIEVVSASKNLADNFSTFALQLVRTMPQLKHLEPKGDQRASNIQWDVGPAEPSKDPSVKSVGITGQITGTRADLIVADDVEVPSNSMTETQREKLRELVKEFDAVIKPGGEIVYLGTPQCEMSLYNELPSRGYDVRIWPARYPTEEQLPNYGIRLAPLIASSWTPEKVWQPTDPKRFSTEDLDQRLASYGRSGFALQFMLDTSLSDADRYPLKISDLLVCDLDPDVAPAQKLLWSSDPRYEIPDLPNVGFKGQRFYRPWETSGDPIAYQGAIMSIDPSGRGRDETGFCVASMLNGYVFVPEAGGMPGGYSEETLERLARIAKEWKVQKIVVESNFGDGMFTQLFLPVLRRIYKDCGVEEVRHSKQKELRIIDTLEPLMNRHRLVISPSVIRKDLKTVQDYPSETRDRYMLIYQLSRITRERGALANDDRLDALAIAVAYWVERLALDEDEQMKTHQQDLLDKQMDEFINRSYFGSNHEPAPLSLL